jgi:S-DNA-T family DNA segregation ATPase FtsK/SpoIIIE
MAAPKKKTNPKKTDFLKEKPGDTQDRISGQDVWNAATLQHEPTRKAVGFLLLVFTAILFISFISFFFSWTRDQSFLADGDWEAFREHQGKIANAMGYLGARLAFSFVHNGFGLGAFALLPLSAFAGLQLLFDYRPYSLLRIAIHSVLFSLWFSLFLGFVFQSWQPVLGGAFGYYSVQKLQDAIGGIGTFLFIAAYATVYSMLFLNMNPFRKMQLRTAVESSLDSLIEEEGELADESEPDEESTAEHEASIIIDDPDEGEYQLAPEEEEDDPTQDLNQIILKRKEEEPARDIPLDVKPAAYQEPEELFFGEPQTTEVTSVEQESSHAETQDSSTEVSLDLGFQVQDLTQNEEESVDENQGDPFSEKKRFGLDTLFDPTLELSHYRFPSLDLLKDYDQGKQEIDMAEIAKSKDLITTTLENYKIGISSIKASIGPTVTLYEIVPAPGVKISKIKNLEDDIALSLAALGIRIIAPIPGRGTIGIEVPNRNPEMVPMRTVLASKKFQESDAALPVVLGKTISNEIFVADLAKMPHLLMAGATGQGKSVGLNAILVSLLYKKHPAYVKFVLVDPKKVELTLFNKIERHFLAKLPGDGDAIITDNSKVINTLNSLCVEMDDRYKLLQDAMVRNIIEYNAKFKERKLNPENGHRHLPYIVVVIDEVADLIMTAGKEVETPIARLAQLARAIGIHLILATQRPSVNVITGMIKANFPARIAFRVTSKIDSRTILDANGADQLIGKGDMLYSGGSDMIRLQCPFVDTPEVERVCEFIGEQRAYSTAYVLPEVKEEGGSLSGGGNFDPDERDSLFADAARVVVQNQVGSTSMIQRKLKIGYNRAGRLMDQLEDAGVVGANQGSKAREVLIPDEMSLEHFLDNLD